MNVCKWSFFAGALGLAVLLTAQSPAQNDEPPPDPTPKGVEVQTRGPVHEAYAEPTETRPQPSVVVPKQPPNVIDEIPPDEKPEGSDVVWIPGYWGWDDDAQDFLWVSGFWRIPPPHRQWMPGSWQQVADGWQWTAGFWAPSDQEELQYLPAPPPSIERGASTPAPDDNSIYSPGCWVYRERRYFWRPGFWVGFRPNWVWLPAHYVWSPGGYVFVEGYWDHPLEQRGLLFAPVRIDPSLLAANWTYTPHYVVQPDFMLGALFVQPNHCHYYFGDFFEKRYEQKGFLPWIDARTTREGIDPNFAYYRHRFAGDGSWEHNLRDLYAGRRGGTIARPPQTLVQQNTVIKNITVNKTQNVAVNKTINLTNIQNVSVVAPITRINNTTVTSLASLNSSKTEVNKVENHVIKMKAVPPEQKVEVRQTVTQLRATAQMRHQAEAKALASGITPFKAADPPRAVKIERPKVPAPAVKAPPDRPQAPPLKEVPRVPTAPKHEDRPVPAHEPPKLPVPAKVPAPPKPAREVIPPKPMVPPAAPAPKEHPSAPKPPAPQPQPPKDAPPPKPHAPPVPPPPKEPAPAPKPPSPKPPALALVDGSHLKCQK